MTEFIPCFCPTLTCFTCYARTIFKAIILLPSPDEQSISDYITNKYSCARLPIIKTVINFLLTNNILEAKSEFIITEPASTSSTNNLNQTVVNSEHSSDLQSEEVEEDAEVTANNNCDGDRIRSNRSDERANAENNIANNGVENQIPIVCATFVCDICNKVCLSAAGLGSHRRVHRS